MNRDVDIEIDNNITFKQGNMYSYFIMFKFVPEFFYQVQSLIF